MLGLTTKTYSPEHGKRSHQKHKPSYSMPVVRPFLLKLFAAACVLDCVSAGEVLEWCTNGQGNAGVGSPCVFPFTYQGQTYSACAEGPKYGGNGWCATAVPYTNKWGGCTLCSQPPPSPPPAPPCTYSLMSDAVSWADADTACQAAGLQLASVQSAAQNALLVTAAAGNQVWIGGTDAASEGMWVWSPSNTLLSYTNWATRQPDNGGAGQDCITFNFLNRGQWDDDYCSANYKPVCQTACPSPPPPLYTLVSNAVSWADADTACQAAGFQLASVQSEAQNALLVTAAAGNQVWIGGTDAASEGTWVWSPSNTPLSYTNWYPGQPDNSRGAQHCIAGNFPNGRTGQWDDENCISKRKFVCQTAFLSLPPSPSPPPPSPSPPLPSPPPPSPSPSPPPSSPPCVDASTKCKKSKCKNYKDAKLQKCKKTCLSCEPLPPSAPSPPPSPPPCSRLSNIKCSKKITIKKCEKKKNKNKCKKYCNKDASKKKPKCEKTCCDLS